MRACVRVWESESGAEGKGGGACIQLGGTRPAIILADAREEILEILGIGIAPLDAPRVLAIEDEPLVAPLRRRWLVHAAAGVKP